MPRKLFEPGDPKLGGRQKGTPNKSTQLLKDAILEAAAGAGGGSIAAYLQEQAKANPGPFLALLGKVLPLQIKGDAKNPLIITAVTHRIVDPKEPDHDQAHLLVQQPDRSSDGQITDPKTRI